jgi:hypothetical protein
MARMSQDKLKALVKNEIQTAVTYLGGEIAEERQQAMEFYNSEPFGNEVEGRSQVISHDVYEVVEGMLPDFVEMFAASDQAVKFTPVGPEDIEAAEQATDYVNHIWLHENPGFQIAHDWIKDALLQKNGYIKIYWDESEVTKRETFDNLTTLGLQELTNDETVEIVEFEEKMAPPELMIPDGFLYDATIKRTIKDGRVKIFGVPPEEFLISRQAVSIDEAVLKGHKFRKTFSELVEMGFDRSKLEGIPSHDSADLSEERLSRFDDEEFMESGNDPSTRYIWVYDCYIKVDQDGDGIAELRNIVVAGDDFRILENTEVDDHPFESLTPIRVPHRHTGKAVADEVIDIQKMKSTVWRQLMDNMYLQNSGRLAINDTVDLDDILADRPGGVVRVQGNMPVGQAIMPIVTQPLGNYAFPVLEYIEGVKESRTGFTRYSQGMDANSLNKTATGINQLLGRSQQRMLMMARLMAETGFAPAMKKILRLVVNHQDRAKTIRLRGKFIEVDPRSWDTDMDVNIMVGLGHGTQEHQAQMLTTVSQIQQQLIGLQGGIDGPFVTENNIYQTQKALTTAMGVKNTDLHFSDPQSPQMMQVKQAKQQAAAQNPPQDPKMVEIQGKMQLSQAEFQNKAQKDQAEMQMKAQQTQEDNALKKYEIDLQDQREREKIARDDERERLKAGLELKTRRDVETEKVRLERDRFDDDRNSRDNPPEVVALGDAKKEMQEAASAISAAIPIVSDAVRKLSAPKRVVYDGTKVVGVEVNGEIQRVVREGGRITGLE